VRTTPDKSAFVPKRKDAIVRQLCDELVVYDKATNKAHCLNESAAEVWNLCDGKRTVAEIVPLLKKKAKAPTDEQMLWMALLRLEKAGLLQNDVPRSGPLCNLSRREASRRVGATAAALAIPVIASILVPKAEAAVSCSMLGGVCSPRPCCPGMLLTCVAHRCV
jgi:Coenzyme PQQ synthesis protein D (PqqD)